MYDSAQVIITSPCLIMIWAAGSAYWGGNQDHQVKQSNYRKKYCIGIRRRPPQLSNGLHEFAEHFDAFSNQGANVSLRPLYSSKIVK